MASEQVAPAAAGSHSCLQDLDRLSYLRNQDRASSSHLGVSWGYRSGGRVWPHAHISPYAAKIRMKAQFSFKPDSVSSIHIK